MSRRGGPHRPPRGSRRTIRPRLQFGEPSRREDPMQLAMRGWLRRPGWTWRFAVLAMVGSAAPAFSQPATIGAGAGSHVLGRLKELDAPRQPPAPRTRLGLDLLRAEMKLPTPFNPKDRAHPSGHDWVL